MKDFKLNYGLVAYLPYCDEDGNTDILHFCGYEQEPNQEEINKLREELSQDSEFGLTEIAKDLIIHLADESLMNHYRKVVGDIK